MTEREKLPRDQFWQSGESHELAWLYNARIEDEMLSCIESKKG
jgi:hypothetical protein